MSFNQVKRLLGQSSKETFCPRGFLSMETFVQGLFVQGDFSPSRLLSWVTFVHGAFCPRELLSKETFVEADFCPRIFFIQGDFCPQTQITHYFCKFRATLKTNHKFWAILKRGVGVGGQKHYLRQSQQRLSIGTKNLKSCLL